MRDLQRIISDLEEQRESIDRALDELRQIAGAGGAGARRSGGITPEGKQRLAESMRRRWAAKRAAKKVARSPKKARRSASKKRG